MPGQRASPPRGSWAAAKGPVRGQRPRIALAQGTPAVLELLREADVQATVSRFGHRATATHFDTNRANYCSPRSLISLRESRRARIRPIAKARIASSECREWLTLAHGIG